MLSLHGQGWLQLEELNLAFALSTLVGVERGEDSYPFDIEYRLPDKLPLPWSAITPWAIGARFHLASQRRRIIDHFFVTSQAIVYGLGIGIGRLPVLAGDVVSGLHHTIPGDTATQDRLRGTHSIRRR